MKEMPKEIVKHENNFLCGNFESKILPYQGQRHLHSWKPLCEMSETERSVPVRGVLFQVTICPQIFDASLSYFFLF